MRVGFIILGLVSLFRCSLSQILAVDFGTEYVKSAVVNSGTGKSFSIVHNSKSERKFLNAVNNFLFRLASITKRDSMSPNLSRRDLNSRLIASSSISYWLIPPSIPKFLPRLKGTFSSSTWKKTVKITWWPNSSSKNFLKNTMNSPWSK